MKLRGLSAAVLAVAGLFAAAEGEASERYGAFVVWDKGDSIILNGVIGRSGLSDFRRALGARPGARVVLLKSGGGDVDAALAIASEIRARGMSTAIPAGFSCYSACTFLFFAGRDHYVRGKLGVHHVASAGTMAAAYDGDVRAALSRYGAPAAVIRVMARTPTDGLYVFTGHEIASLGINRGGSGSLAAAYASR